MSMLPTHIEAILKADRVDQPTAAITYVGILQPGTGLWMIKKIEKIGSETFFQYPDGQNDFKFDWNQRATYNYMDRRA